LKKKFSKLIWAAEGLTECKEGWKCATRGERRGTCSELQQLLGWFGCCMKPKRGRRGEREKKKCHLFCDLFNMQCSAFSVKQKHLPLLV